MQDDYGIFDPDAAAERWHILHNNDEMPPDFSSNDNELPDDDGDGFVCLAGRFRESACEWWLEEDAEGLAPVA